MPRRYVIVLVAIVLVVLGAGFLFTAVPRFHEASMRLICQNNFSQWGKAFHNYASANQEKLPPGTLPNADLPPEQRLSLWVPLLPFMEHDDVYKQFDLTRGAADPRNAEPTSTRIKFLVCPMSGEYDPETKRWKSRAPLTHYVGVAGVGADAAALPLRHPKAGVFGHDRRTLLSESHPDGFPDGTSNTLALIETGQNPGHWAFGGTATVRAFDPGAAPYIGPGHPFGGFHGNYWLGTPSCVAALADGSVRDFTTKTDPKLLEALATVGGKEPLPKDW